MKTGTKTFIGVLGAAMVLMSFIGKEILVDLYRDDLTDLAASNILLVTRRDVQRAQEATQRTLDEEKRDAGQLGPLEFCRKRKDG